MCFLRLLLICVLVLNTTFVFSQLDKAKKLSKDLSFLGIYFGSSSASVENVLASRNSFKEASSTQYEQRYKNVKLGSIRAESMYFLYDQNDFMYGVVTIIKESPSYISATRSFDYISKTLYTKYGASTKAFNKYFNYGGKKVLEKTRAWHLYNPVTLKKFIISLTLRPYSENEDVKEYLLKSFEFEQSGTLGPKEHSEKSTVLQDAYKRTLRVEISYQDVVLYTAYRNWQDVKDIEDF